MSLFAQPTFGAVLGGLCEQSLSVIGAFKATLNASAETHVVLTLGRRDGETTLLVKGEVRVRVRVLTWGEERERERERESARASERERDTTTQGKR